MYFIKAYVETKCCNFKKCLICQNFSVVKIQFIKIVYGRVPFGGFNNMGLNVKRNKFTFNGKILIRKSSRGS